MKPIDLHLDDDVIVKGCLYPTKDPVYLREDLLEIDLPSGLTIDVGWYPEGDPEGKYRIVLFRGYWENQLLEPITTPDTDKATKIIETLSAMYATPRLFSSSSSWSLGPGAPSIVVFGGRGLRSSSSSSGPPRRLLNEVTSGSTSSQVQPREYALS